MMLRTVLLLFLAVGVFLPFRADAVELPLYQCAVTGENVSRELRVQCTIEEPVEEDLLTELSCRVWRMFYGSRYGLFVIHWDYDVESLDNVPWGTAFFVGNRLDSVKIRQLRHNHAVGYRLYSKNLTMMRFGK